MHLVNLSEACARTPSYNFGEGSDTANSGSSTYPMQRRQSAQKIVPTVDQRYVPGTKKRGRKRSVSRPSRDARASISQRPIPDSSDGVERRVSAVEVLAESAHERNGARTAAPATRCWSSSVVASTEQAAASSSSAV